MQVNLGIDAKTQFIIPFRYLKTDVSFANMIYGYLKVSSETYVYLVKKELSGVNMSVVNRFKDTEKTLGIFKRNTAQKSSVNLPHSSIPSAGKRQFDSSVTPHKVRTRGHTLTPHTGKYDDNLAISTPIRSIDQKLDQSFAFGIDGNRINPSIDNQENPKDFKRISVLDVIIGEKLAFEMQYIEELPFRFKSLYLKLLSRVFFRQIPMTTIRSFISSPHQWTIFVNMATFNCWNVTARYINKTYSTDHDRIVNKYRKHIKHLAEQAIDSLKKIETQTIDYLKYIYRICTFIRKGLLYGCFNLFEVQTLCSQFMEILDKEIQTAKQMTSKQIEKKDSQSLKAAKIPAIQNAVVRKKIEGELLSILEISGFYRRFFTSFLVEHHAYAALFFGAELESQWMRSFYLFDLMDMKFQFQKTKKLNYITVMEEKTVKSNVHDNRVIKEEGAALKLDFYDDRKIQEEKDNKGLNTHEDQIVNEKHILAESNLQNRPVASNIQLVSDCWTRQLNANPEDSQALGIAQENMFASYHWELLDKCSKYFSEEANKNQREHRKFKAAKQLTFIKIKKSQVQDATSMSKQLKTFAEASVKNKRSQFSKTPKKQKKQVQDDREIDNRVLPFDQMFLDYNQVIIESKSEIIDKRNIQNLAEFANEYKNLLMKIRRAQLQSLKVFLTHTSLRKEFSSLMESLFTQASHFNLDEYLQSSWKNTAEVTDLSENLHPFADFQSYQFPQKSNQNVDTFNQMGSLRRMPESKFKTEIKLKHEIEIKDGVYSRKPSKFKQNNGKGHTIHSHSNLNIFKNNNFKKSNNSITENDSIQPFNLSKPDNVTSCRARPSKAPWAEEQNLNARHKQTESPQTTFDSAIKHFIIFYEINNQTEVEIINIQINKCLEILKKAEGEKFKNKVFVNLQSIMRSCHFERTFDTLHSIIPKAEYKDVMQRFVGLLEFYLKDNHLNQQRSWLQCPKFIDLIVSHDIDTSRLVISIVKSQAHIKEVYEMIQKVIKAVETIYLKSMLDTEQKKKARQKLKSLSSIITGIAFTYPRHNGQIANFIFKQLLKNYFLADLMSLRIMPKLFEDRNQFLNSDLCIMVLSIARLAPQHIVLPSMSAICKSMHAFFKKVADFHPIKIVLMEFYVDNFFWNINETFDFKLFKEFVTQIFASELNMILNYLCQLSQQKETEIRPLDHLALYRRVLEYLYTRKHSQVAGFLITFNRILIILQKQLQDQKQTWPKTESDHNKISGMNRRQRLLAIDEIVDCLSKVFDSLQISCLESVLKKEDLKIHFNVNSIGFVQLLLLIKQMDTRLQATLSLSAFEIEESKPTERDHMTPPYVTVNKGMDKTTSLILNAVTNEIISLSLNQKFDLEYLLSSLEFQSQGTFEEKLNNLFFLIGKNEDGCITLLDEPMEELQPVPKKKEARESDIFGKSQPKMVMKSALKKVLLAKLPLNIIKTSHKASSSQTQLEQSQQDKHKAEGSSVIPLLDSNTDRTALIENPDEFQFDLSHITAESIYDKLFSLAQLQERVLIKSPPFATYPISSKYPELIPRLEKRFCSIKQYTAIFKFIKSNTVISDFSFMVLFNHFVPKNPKVIAKSKSIEIPKFFVCFYQLGLKQIANQNSNKPKNNINDQTVNIPISFDILRTLINYIIFSKHEKLVRLSLSILNYLSKLNWSSFVSSLMDVIYSEPFMLADFLRKLSHLLSELGKSYYETITKPDPHLQFNCDFSKDQKRIEKDREKLRDVLHLIFLISGFKVADLKESAQGIKHNSDVIKFQICKTISVMFLSIADVLCTNPNFTYSKEDKKIMMQMFLILEISFKNNQWSTASLLKLTKTYINEFQQINQQELDYIRSNYLFCHYTNLLVRLIHLMWVAAKSTSPESEFERLNDDCNYFIEMCNKIYQNVIKPKQRLFTRDKLCSLKKKSRNQKECLCEPDNCLEGLISLAEYSLFEMAFKSYLAYKEMTLGSADFTKNSKESVLWKRIENSSFKYFSQSEVNVELCLNGTLVNYSFQKQLICFHFDRGLNYKFIAKLSKTHTHDDYRVIFDEIPYYFEQMILNERFSTNWLMNFAVHNSEVLALVVYIISLLINVLLLYAVRSLSSDDIDTSLTSRTFISNVFVHNENEGTYLIVYLVFGMISLLFGFYDLVSKLIITWHKSSIFVNEMASLYGLNQTKNKLVLSKNFAFQKLSLKIMEKLDRINQLQKRNPRIQKVFSLFTTTNVYSFAFFILLLMSFMFPFLWPFLLLDIFRINSGLFYLLKASGSSIGRLLKVVSTCIIITYVYSTLIFTFFNSEVTLSTGTRIIFETLSECFYSTFMNGFTFMLGIGNFLGETTIIDTKFWQRFFLDVSYFLVISTIALNTLYAIVIENYFAFSRKEKNKNRTLERVCYICQRNQHDLKFTNEDFEEHVQHKHNVKSYFFLFVNLFLGKSSSSNYIERILTQMVQEKDFTFIPIKPKTKSN